MCMIFGRDKENIYYIYRVKFPAILVNVTPLLASDKSPQHPSTFSYNYAYNPETVNTFAFVSLYATLSSEQYSSKANV